MSTAFAPAPFAPAPFPGARSGLRKSQRGFILINPFMATPAAAPPPAAEVTETFLGTAATSITARASDSGATWSMINPGSQNFLVDGSGAGYTSGAGVRSLAVPSVTPGSKNQIVQIDFIIASVGKTTGAIVARAVDENNWYAAFYNSGSIYLVQRVSGTETNLGSYALPGGGAGTWTVKLEVTDAYKRVSVNGTQQINYTTTNDLTAVGKYGLGNFFADVSGWGWDNFTATSI